MAKNDRSNVNRALEQERNTLNNQINPFLNTVNQNIQTNTALANEQARTATDNYSNIYNTAGNIGLDPTVVANLRALNRPGSNALSGSSGGSSDGGGGGGGSSTPNDPFATSRAAFANFINSGGVDIGAMKEALGGYRNLAESGGFSPEQRGSIENLAGRLSAIGETGGYDPATLAEIKKNTNVLSSIGQTGGFSPEQLGLIRGDIAGLRSIGQTGGVNAEDINRARGYGVFENFANTGGFSDADIQNLRSRAISPIGSLYAQDVQAANRSNSLLGSAAPNSAAILARLSRNRGLGLSDAAREAELGIQEQIRSNKLAGAEKGSAAELALQDLLTKNKLTGLSASAQGESNLADAIAKNKISGATGASTQLQNLQNAITNAKLQGNQQAAAILGDLYNSIASNQLGALGGITQTQQGAEEIAQRGKLAGAEGMFGVEQATESARQAEAASRAYSDAVSAAQRAADEQFWAEFNAGNERWIGENMLNASGMGLEGQLAAMGGLTSLYGTAPGAVGQDYNAYLQAALGRNQGSTNTIDIQQRNIGPSLMDRIMQIGGMVAPIAGAFTGGLTGGPTSGSRLTSMGSPTSTGYSNIGSNITMPTQFRPYQFGSFGGR